MQWLVVFIAGMLSLLGGQAVAASFSINPTTFTLSGQRATAVIQVVNNGAEPVRLQADALRWGTDGTEETLTDTDEVVLNPPIFTIAPGKVQFLRFGLRDAGSGPRERSYRILLEEIPDGGSQGAGLRTLLRISAPVFMPPLQPIEKLHWEVVRTTTGSELIAANEGNVHAKLHALRLLDDAGTKTVFSAGLTYVLPGQRRHWKLPPEAAAMMHLRLQADTGEGSLEQRVDVAP